VALLLPKDLSKGTIIAMYGGVIFDRKNEIPEALGYSLDMKDSRKTLTINGYHWYNLPPEENRDKGWIGCRPRKCQQDKISG
jgi:hypothetical protein